MTPRRETQIIIIGTIIGLGMIVSSYLWLQNYLFPPGTQASLRAFEKMVNEPDPFWDHYRLARTYLEERKYDLALEEGTRALEEAEAKKNDTYIGMAHGRLLDICLVMGDVANAEKELDWLDEDVRKSGAWDIQKNATQTLGDIQMEYRRRLEELKKSQRSSPAAVGTE